MKPPRRAPRRRVPGGKALARILFFKQQRADQVGEGTREVAKRCRSADPRRQRNTQRQTHTPARIEIPATAAAAAGPQRWHPIGPRSIPHGQTYGAGTGARPSVAGRVSSLAIDPGDPKHILIGAGGGGVWETRDEGKTWTPRTDDQPSLSIGALVFDPRDHNIVYAGTGEGDNSDPDDGSNLLGKGLLLSKNGGRDWEVLTREPFEKIGIYDIAIDPRDSRHLLVATSVALFESTNGGTKWSRVRDERTWNVSFAPGEVFAACQDGLHRRTNKNWLRVTLKGATKQFERLEICHASSDPNVAYAFGSGLKNDETWVALWRRPVFARDFERIETPAEIDVSQAWYDWFAAVAPNHPNVVYLGAIEAYRGVRAPNGGWDWTNLSGKETGDSIHPDQHAIAFDPRDPNILYIGNDGGIYRSPDAGVTWRSLNKGLAIAEIEFLAQHPQHEAWLLAGTQDNGTLRYRGDHVWFHVGDGDGGDCGLDAGSPYTCYHTYDGMGLSKSTRGGDWNSFTPGPKWIIGPPFAKAENYPDGSLFYPPADVNGRVIAQAGNIVFLSSNGGIGWTRVPLPAETDEFASALLVATPALVYAATNAGRVFRIERDGKRWRQPIELVSPAVGFISDLLVDPSRPNRLYATYSSTGKGGTIFRSDDGGTQTWIEINAGLEPRGIPVNAIEIDPANPDTLYCACDVGVYLTRNGGNAWSLFNNGLPNALVKDLVLHPEARLLRAGTQARGVWEISVDAAALPAVEVYLRDSSVDTGRLSPSPSGVDDPFSFGAKTFWWQCQDIKVDSPTFLRPAISDLDFETFCDDHSMIADRIEFAAGLTNENPQRGLVVRVYVQVHNRGVDPALDVSVKVFFAAGGLSLPDLPADFWSNFPNNALAPDSPWQPVAPHHAFAGIAPNEAGIAGFEWKVPDDAPDTIALLAILTAANDPLVTTERDVAALVRSQKKCGLRNVTVLNPPAQAGPPVRSMVLEAPPRASIEIDRAAASMMRALILSKPLASAAKKAKWKRVRLTPDDEVELARVLETRPELKPKLDRTSAFAPAGEPLPASAEGGEPIILLMQPSPKAGSGSIVQRDAGGTVRGGITLHTRKQR